MRPVLLSVYFVLMICSNTLGQSALKGKVIAADTRKPVALANVYLSNTAIGTLTDEDGGFIITAFPKGRFDLVVSFMGYETYTVNIQSANLPSVLEIVLQPKVNELQEVIVEPYDKDGWEKWGRFFLDNFIGTSVYAYNCKLLNKDAVKFRFSKQKNTLQAFADETLVVENKSLGYRVKYDLTLFEFDYTARKLYYQGYPFFEELDPSARTSLRRRWESNREYSYYGSLMHFMRSLYRNRIMEEGFEVRKLVKVINEEKKRVRAIYQPQVQKIVSDGEVVISMGSGMAAALIGNKDSAAYYKRVMHNPDVMDVLDKTLLPGDSIAFAIDSTTAGLYFEDHLQIIYPAKRTPAEYQTLIPARAKQPPPITSVVSIIKGEAIAVLSNGSIFEGINLLTQGYWALSEKIGNMLPYDYWPGKKKQ